MSTENNISNNNVEETPVLSLTLGAGGDNLPCPSAFTAYNVTIGEETLTFHNEKLSVKTDIPYSAFSSAEFGIGSGNLWLQCVVNGSPLVFCMPRKNWKSEKAKYLMDKIGQVTELKEKKEFDHYTGKLFFLYMFK